MSIESLKSIVKEISSKRNYDRVDKTQQIEASWKTDQESKRYDKQWNSSWSREGDEKEPDFIELETLLEKVCPKISYLQVQKLLRTLLETKSEHVSDYYERYTLNVKFINIKKLHDYLEQEGLV